MSEGLLAMDGEVFGGRARRIGGPKGSAWVGEPARRQTDGL
jgi:hypothetical protein